MEIRKKHILVEEDKKLIIDLCRVAFENDFSINEWIRPENLKKFSDAEIKHLIENFAFYNAKALTFRVHKKRGILEIIFHHFYPDDVSENIYNGHDKYELQLAIE